MRVPVSVQVLKSAESEVQTGFAKMPWRSSSVGTCTLARRSFLTAVPAAQRPGIALARVSVMSVAPATGAGGQGRVNLQALFRESDAQVIAVADPAQSVSLEDFYYKGTGGRSPTRDLIEKHYAPKTPNFRCTEYEDFRLMLDWQ